jgi:hypothetical protein
LVPVLDVDETELGSFPRPASGQPDELHERGERWPQVEQHGLDPVIGHRLPRRGVDDR